LAAVPDESGGLTLQPGAQIAFDTYFNALFERAWRAHVGVERFRLELELRGRAVVRIWRRTLGTGPSLLHEGVASGTVSIAVPAAGEVLRASGLVWFELAALEAPVTLVAGSWTAPETVARPVSIGVVICTMNREAALGAVLGAIAEHKALDEVVGRVIVVNQGAAGLRQRLAPVALRLGPRLKLVEQGNFGGAGGFGRGMIEAIDDQAVTHVCLLDDDVRLEPDSLLRMAALFSAARTPIAVGGHMLDSVQPTRLYEAGGRVLADGTLQPIRPVQDLVEGAALEALLDTPPMHYNGWWMFGLEKSVLRRIGLPLPCFIRGDDVEYGMRLHKAGIPSVGLPGIGIWHEPFYLKIGGWQLYYEVRNALIAMVLHQGFGARHIALSAFKQVMTYLLTFRYGSAALVVRGVQDFCRGPGLLEGAPGPLHGEIVALRKRYADERTEDALALPQARLREAPRSKAGFAVDFAAAVLRNLFAPSRPRAEARRIVAHDLVWFRVRKTDCLAVDTYWDARLPTYRRDRAVFRSLFRSGLLASLRLYREGASLRAAWSEAAPTLTSETFWRTYVPVQAVASRVADGSDREPELRPVGVGSGN
jgi:galactofuranosylgalactofuranosylrhamnosyl-N-acetylglucosaminyl-diphospho-decaprenol beta-1,5/1,6-galactofuranosyltransferase